MRSIERKNELGEVFTPPTLIKEIISNMREDSFNIDKTFFDPTCGNGNILIYVLQYKFKIHRDKLNEDIVLRILSSIYGVDIMPDNVLDSRKRLYKLTIKLLERLDIEINKMKIIEILKKNIRLGDVMEYDYNFEEMK